MTLPAELLAIAQATRDTFGPSVKLKFAAWPDSQAGNAAYDDPARDSCIVSERRHNQPHALVAGDRNV